MEVVIVTKDRHRLFEQTVRSLYAHTLEGSFNLWVVDDCSEDVAPTLVLAEEFGFHLAINSEPAPLGGNKNKAIAALAEDSLVYVSDNDVYFTEHWFAVLWSAWYYRPDDIKLLGGGCHEYLRTNRVERGSHAPPEYHYKDAVSGWSHLFHWRTWRDFGGYDENALGVGKSEDWAFCQRIKQGGYEVASIWPEVVIHCGRTNSEGQPAIGAETIRDHPGVIVE